MRIPFTAWVVVAAISSPLCPARAMADETPGISLTPVHVTAYKNGLSWVVAEGRGDPDGDGRVTLLEPLHALYGSLHLTTRDGVKIRSAVSAEVETRRSPRDLGELADPYKGRKVDVRTDGGRIHGILQDVITLPSGGRGLLLVADDVRTLIPFDEVKEMNLWGPTNLTGAVDRRRVLRITFEDPGDKVHLAAEYLTDRFGWLPEYRIDTSDSKKALLHMDAYVLNDLTDLSGAEVFLATGVARFNQSTSPTPLEAEGDMASILWRMSAGDGPGGLLGNTPNMMRQVMSNDPHHLDAGMGGQDGGEAFGQVHEDTFLYGPLDLNLDKGERGRYPVLKRKVPYEDLFYWDVGDGMLDPESPPPVWLAVQLRNTTPGPLTTGPVTVVEGGKPVGQGLLTYTAAGDEAVIKVSRSTRVMGSVQETEVSRDGRAAKVAGLTVDRLVLDGALVLRNTSPQAVRVRAVRRLVGALDREPEGAKVRETLLQPGAINTSTTITWDLELPAATERRLTYRYRVLQYAD
ncbi:MAG: hypothetical protein ABIK09_00090 [Pseudomonadota bacterium]